MDTKHHRRPRRLGGLTISSNISHVSDKSHAAWHQLFNHMEAFDICDLINRIWLDPKYKFVCVEREPNDPCNYKTKKDIPLEPEQCEIHVIDSRYRRKLASRETAPTPANTEELTSSGEPIHYNIMTRKVRVKNGHWFFTNNAEQLTTVPASTLESW